MPVHSILKQDVGVTGVVCLAVRDLYSNMDHTGEAFSPFLMLNVLHMCYPQFAEKDDHGHLSQQVRVTCHL